MLARESLADYDHRSRSVAVAIIKVAPLDYRDTHRLEIADTGREEFGGRMILWRHRPAVDLKRDNEAVTAQRQRIYCAGRLNPGCRFEPFLQVDEKLTLPVPLVLDLGQRQIEGENVLRL